MKNRGFTLIELLVVIAVIGILASVVMASLNSARKKAQDTKIRAELKQLATALEFYFDKYGTYVVAGSGWNDCGCGWVTHDQGPSGRTVVQALVAEGFMSTDFDEPGGFNYMLYNCGTERYALSATLNNPTAQDIAYIQTTCNGTGGNGTYTHYGKNFAIEKL